MPKVSKQRLRQRQQAMSKSNLLTEEAFSNGENAETYEQLDLSELIYGMPMGEADFYAERGAGNPVQ